MPVNTKKIADEEETWDTETKGPPPDLRLQVGERRQDVWVGRGVGRGAEGGPVRSVWAGDGGAE